jgi:hypothetical protein
VSEPRAANREDDPPAVRASNLNSLLFVLGLDCGYARGLQPGLEGKRVVATTRRRLLAGYY